MSIFRRLQSDKSLITELWESFWEPPGGTCPKCGSSAVDYYDPFFFSPVRTFKGTRRHKCTLCKFVWRPNRKHSSPFWQGF